MTLRLDYIVVFLIVTIIFIGSIYLMDFVFSEHYNETYNKYNSQFAEIESAIGDGNYQHAIALSEQIIEEDGTGVNEIKARAYIGLSELKMDDIASSTSNLSFLIEKYPGIKLVYAELLDVNGGKKDNLTSIYNSILIDYIPGYSEAVTGDVELPDIAKQMNERRALGRSGWTWFILLQGASIYVYERIRKRLMASESDAQ